MFESKDDILDYLSGDKVECLECGKFFKNLSLHLTLTHNINPDDYREKHGIPMYMGLCSADYAEKHRRNIIKRQKTGEMTTDFRHVDRKKIPKARRKKPKYQQDKFFKNAGAWNKYVDKTICEEFLRRIASGRSIESVEKDQDMPSSQSVYNYTKDDSDFKDRWVAVTKENKSNLIKKVREREKNAYCVDSYYDTLKT